ADVDDADGTFGIERIGLVVAVGLTFIGDQYFAAVGGKGQHVRQITNADIVQHRQRGGIVEADMALLLAAISTVHHGVGNGDHTVVDGDAVGHGAAAASGGEAGVQRGFQRQAAAGIHGIDLDGGAGNHEHT